MEEYFDGDVKTMDKAAKLTVKELENMDGVKVRVECWNESRTDRCETMSTVDAKDRSVHGDDGQDDYFDEYEKLWCAYSV